MLQETQGWLPRWRGHAHPKAPGSVPHGAPTPGNTEPGSLTRGRPSAALPSAPLRSGRLCPSACTRCPLSSATPRGAPRPDILTFVQTAKHTADCKCADVETGSRPSPSPRGPRQGLPLRCPKRWVEQVNAVKEVSSKTRDVQGASARAGLDQNHAALGWKES